MHIPKHWNEWLQEQGTETGFCQTSDWAKINLKINKKPPYWIEIIDKERRLLGGLFSTNKNSFKDNICKLLNKKRGYLECYEGPVFAKDSSLPELTAFLMEVEKLSKQLNIKTIRLYAPPLSLWQHDDEYKKIFFDFGYIVNPWQTSIVDISQTPDILIKTFDHAIRKGINRCLNEGVIVKKCETIDIYKEKFLYPYFETRSKLGFLTPKSIDDFVWWSEDVQNSYAYYIAEDSTGDILATLGTYRFNKMVTEIMSERTLKARNSKVPVQDFLHFKVMAEHHAQGDLFFNLAGFNPNPKDEKEKGIKMFKLKWNGRVLNYNCFEKNAGG